MQNDPISDLLTRIRNSVARKHAEVVIPYSKIKEEIVKIFKSHNYIESYALANDNTHKNLVVTLKYGANGESAISNLKRISKPGLRVYTQKDKLPRVLNGIGTAVISTPKGLMDTKEARSKGLGGEVICTIY
jgi:small subunit ribosomal protein S8